MAALSGDHRLSLFRDRPFTRLALIGVALAALTLAGCGRKGPLDPPPGASMASEPTPAPDVPATADPLITPLGQTNENRAPRATVPAGPNKRIFLDNLLN
jgi:predicted small lipoprotein YifL